MIKIQKSVQARVDTEFYEWLKEIAKENRCSIIQASKIVGKDHKQLQYYLKKKQNQGEVILSLRI